MRSTANITYWLTDLYARTQNDRRKRMTDYPAQSGAYEGALKILEINLKAAAKLQSKKDISDHFALDMARVEINNAIKIIERALDRGKELEND